jgi:hypothetical protein
MNYGKKIFLYCFRQYVVMLYDCIQVIDLTWAKSKGLTFLELFTVLALNVVIPSIMSLRYCFLLTLDEVYEILLRSGYFNEKDISSLWMFSLYYQFTVFLNKSTRERSMNEYSIVKRDCLWRINKTTHRMWKNHGRLYGGRIELFRIHSFIHSFKLFLDILFTVFIHLFIYLFMYY